MDEEIEDVKKGMIDDFINYGIDKEEAIEFLNERSEWILHQPFEYWLKIFLEHKSNE